LNGIYEEGTRVVNIGNVRCTSVYHLLPSPLLPTHTDITMSKLNQFYFFPAGMNPVKSA